MSPRGAASDKSQFLYEIMERDFLHFFVDSHRKKFTVISVGVWGLRRELCSYRRMKACLWWAFVYLSSIEASTSLSLCFARSNSNLSFMTLTKCIMIVLKDADEI